MYFDSQIYLNENPTKDPAYTSSITKTGFTNWQFHIYDNQQNAPTNLDLNIADGTDYVIDIKTERYPNGVQIVYNRTFIDGVQVDYFVEGDTNTEITTFSQYGTNQITLSGSSPEANISDSLLYIAIYKR